MEKYTSKIDVENKLINNSNEIEFKLRSTAFKYKDKSYCAYFDNLAGRKNLIQLK